ncbi:MAG TPA: Fic family protein [Gaiellaceae bacterium]|nr:Fic family protein [Gaiellaceae bacterium]
MRVFATPLLSFEDESVLELIGEVRQELVRRGIGEPRRWAGGLRRMAVARAVQGSNSIEGYRASLDDVLAVVDGEAPLDATEETRQALLGYQEAMTYVLQAAQDEIQLIDEGFIKALHFMMMKYDLSKWPGRWRPGEIFVHRDDTGERVYEGPDAGDVPELIGSMLQQLELTDARPLVRAAMAHLNLVMIHPFRDGNGRMARCLQTYVLARERMIAPVFSSIEEYLGRNTPAYYEILDAVGRGSWQPENDALPWVRFCLTGHYRQAVTTLRRMQRLEDLWRRIAEIAERRRLPERVVGPLVEAAYSGRIRRATYVESVETTHGESIADLTASRDLKALVNAGLFEPVGDTKGRYYTPTDELLGARREVALAHPRRGEDDPYVIARERSQLALDLEAN